MCGKELCEHLLCPSMDIFMHVIMGMLIHLFCVLASWSASNFLTERALLSMFEIFQGQMASEMSFVCLFPVNSAISSVQVYLLNPCPCAVHTQTADQSATVGAFCQSLVRRGSSYSPQLRDEVN